MWYQKKSSRQRYWGGKRWGTRPKDFTHVQVARQPHLGQHPHPLPQDMMMNPVAKTKFNPASPRLQVGSLQKFAWEKRNGEKAERRWWWKKLQLLLLLLLLVLVAVGCGMLQAVWREAKQMGSLYYYAS